MRLSTCRFLARSNVRLVPTLAIWMLPSVLLKSTVAPGATLLAVPPLVLTSQPREAVASTASKAS